MSCELLYDRGTVLLRRLFRIWSVRLILSHRHASSSFRPRFSPRGDSSALKGVFRPRSPMFDSVKCFDNLRLLLGEPLLLELLSIRNEFVPGVFAMLMTWRSQSLCGECMNRSGQMRKNFDTVLAEFLARFLPRFLCIGDGGNAQRGVPLELPDGLFAFRRAQKLREVEKTAQNSESDGVRRGAERGAEGGCGARRPPERRGWPGPARETADCMRRKRRNQKSIRCAMLAAHVQPSPARWVVLAGDELNDLANSCAAPVGVAASNASSSADSRC